jgi:hypothetical protein
MKIKLKKETETENEVEFPVPSFWEHFGMRYMVTDTNIIWVAEGLIAADYISSSDYQRQIGKIIEGKYEQISQDEFFEKYIEATATINQAIQIESEA